MWCVWGFGTLTLRHCPLILCFTAYVVVEVCPKGIYAEPRYGDLAYKHMLILVRFHVRKAINR